MHVVHMPADEPDIIAHLPRVTVKHVLCRACGYEPERGQRRPVQCPKCHGGGWDRFVRRGKLNYLPDTER